MDSRRGLGGLAVLLSVAVGGGAVLLAAASAAAGAGEAGYVGSERCGSCHAREWASWAESLHGRMMRPLDAGEALTTKPFADGRAPFVKRDVARVLGNMYKLVYLKRRGAGLVILPRQVDIASGRWEPFVPGEWDDALRGAGAEVAADDWGRRCAGCHVTGWTPTTRTHAEDSIGCEACHGPGGRHAESKKRDDIVNPATLPAARGVQVCGRCHSRGTTKDGAYPYPVGFQPGDDLAAVFDTFTPTRGSNTRRFWANGMTRQHHAQYNDFVGSKHFREGVRCFDCHLVHRARAARPSPNTRLIAKAERYLLKERAELVCVECHADREATFEIREEKGRRTIVDRHTRHPLVVEIVEIGEQRRTKTHRMHCSDCHMPRSKATESSYTVEAHTFTVPRPEDTVRFGAPNGCDHCHARGAAWARERIAEWRAGSS